MTLQITIQVKLTENTEAGTYSWDFSTAENGTFPLVEGKVNLSIAANTAVKFALTTSRGFGLEAGGTNFLDGKYYSTGTGTITVFGAAPGAAGSQIEISLSQVTEQPVSIAISEASSPTASFALREKILGIYQSSSTFYLPPGNSLAFAIASDQAGAYQLENNAVSWLTANQMKPSWIGYSGNKAGSDVVIKDDSSLEAPSQSASFQLKIQNKVTQTEVSVDPTVANRGSMTDMWEPGT